jgi:N-acetylglutamate synthase-like GNAT family acetyltransferase
MLSALQIAADDAGLVAALADEGLATGDLAGAHKHYFAFQGRSSAVVGYGGMELYGELALLRSLVVLPAHRKAGHGRRLIAHLVERARECGARELYLLTTTAVPFFLRLGFQRLERSLAPPEIATSSQFSSLCPASAVLMTAAVDRLHTRSWAAAP